jgi:DNA-binding response OmpR family regulator
MLPSRAYANTLPTFSPGRPPVRAAGAAAAWLVTAAPDALDRFSVSSFTRVAAHTTLDALHALERVRPRVTAIDWDWDEVDAEAICRRARHLNCGGVLVVTERPHCVPRALRAGCDSVLLRPFVPNLLAARVGRLSRELAALPASDAGASVPLGTNRIWTRTRCPECDAGGAVSFEFFSYRRMWYACLACDHVWLGPRQEV